MPKSPVTVTIENQWIQKVRSLAGPGKAIGQAELFEAAIMLFFELDPDGRMEAIETIRRPDLRKAVEDDEGAARTAVAAKKGKRAG